MGLSGRRRLMVLAVVALAVMWARLHAPAPGASVFHHDLRASELDVPLAPVGAGPSSFEFLRLDAAGKPVRFDPCRTIHYRVHIGHGPLNGSAVVQEAVARVSRASGLRFAFDGTTDAMLTRWEGQMVTEPVWIGWANADETDAYLMAQTPPIDPIGVGGPISARRPGGQEVYVTGAIVLKPTRDLRSGFGPGESEGNTLLHELGHLVGLAHTAGSIEIMNPMTGQGLPDGYGPGDLAGLYALGAASGCL